MGYIECLLSCQWALTRKRTPWGRGALEVGDHCLFEDGSDRGGALYPKLVKTETAQGMGEVVAVRG